MSMRNFLSILLIGFFSTFLPRFLPAKEVKGVVFEDVNRNLMLDAGEAGIPGILVSNQQEVVKTDEKGRYRLKVTEETIIFVTQPRGYTLPVNELNLPQFYYIHQPKGSPALQYPGVAPTGKLPASVNFPLLKTTESDSFEIVIFSDPQPRDSMEIDYIRDDVAAELVGTNAAFGITLGDIMYDKLGNFDYYNRVAAQIGIPFFNVPGNHDMNYDAPDDHYATETYKRHFGPNYYAFERGQVHFMVLDVVEWQGRNAEGKGSYIGKIGTKQLEWVKNQLAHVPMDRLIVLALHIPLYYFNDPNPVVNVSDREALLQLLAHRQRILALAGHMHVIDHSFLAQNAGWPGQNPIHQIICSAACGSWWGGPKDERGIPITDQRDGTPNGYHILRFTGNQYTARFKPANRDANFQLRISAPTGTVRAGQDSLIIVNVFDGSERSVVEHQLDEGAFRPMQRVVRKDPYIEAIHANFSGTYASWIQPEPSSHIWIAPLPADLKPGLHKLLVKTRDQFGQTYQTAQIFVIE